VGHVILGKPERKLWWKKLFRKEGVLTNLLSRGIDSMLTLIDIQIRTTEMEEGHNQELVNSKLINGNNDKWRLCDFLMLEQIKIWDEPISKSQILNELVSGIVLANPNLEKDFLLQKLNERENEGSTFLNEGIALPHARIPDLPKPLVALGLTHSGILDSFTENPIEVVFLLLSPKDSNRSHLQLLAIVGRLMMNRALRNKLQKIKNPNAVYSILKNAESDLNSSR